MNLAKERDTETQKIWIVVKIYQNLNRLTYSL